MSDECIVELAEQGGNPDRIRRIRPGLVPAPLNGDTPFPPVDAPVVQDPAKRSGTVVNAHAEWIGARFGSSPHGGPIYRGILACRWHSDYRPSSSDRALVGVLVDHAVALIRRDRTARAGERNGDLGLSLPTTYRIAAASGILMALYHLSLDQARHLLIRASEHNHRSVGDIADTVLRTGPPRPESPLPGCRGSQARAWSVPVLRVLRTDWLVTAAGWRTLGRHCGQLAADRHLRVRLARFRWPTAGKMNRGLRVIPATSGR